MKLGVTVPVGRFVFLPSSNNARTCSSITVIFLAGESPMSGVVAQHSAGPVVWLPMACTDYYYYLELFEEKSEPSDHIHPPTRGNAVSKRLGGTLTLTLRLTLAV